jgi:glycerol uptake facilitator protein
MDEIGPILLSETAGSGVMMTIGVGVAANATLVRTFGRGGGYLMIALGWALGVYAGVYVAHDSGAHLNPAVTVGKLMSWLVAGGPGQFAPGIAITGATTAAYLAAELLGAFCGAVLAWSVYREHYDLHPKPVEVLATMATGPAIRSLPRNLLGEAVATFVLVLVLMRLDLTPSQVGPLGVALTVLGIGLGLGGVTGWAINPARDLGARVAHAVLPIRGKGGSNWSYAWVPVVGPLVGGSCGAIAAQLMA